MFIYDFLAKNKNTIIAWIVVLSLTTGAAVLADVLIYGGSNTIYESPSNGDNETLGSVTAVTGVCSGYEATTQLCQVNIRELQIGTDLTVDDDTTLTGDLSVNGTTTMQEIILGSRYNTGLTFTATSTPGGLVSLRNTGARKICSNVVLDIKTRDSAEGGCPLSFSLGTSTAAIGDYSWEDSPGLIATTTLPTSTTAFISKETHPGSVKSSCYLCDDYASSTVSWVWDNGVYIVGTVESVTASGDSKFATSSEAWEDTVGEMYVYCHSE